MKKVLAIGLVLAGLTYGTKPKELKEMTFGDTLTLTMKVLKEKIVDLNDKFYYNQVPQNKENLKKMNDWLYKYEKLNNMCLEVKDCKWDDDGYIKERYIH